MVGVCRKTRWACEGAAKDCHFMDALLNRKVVVNELNMHCMYWEVGKGDTVVNKKEIMQWMLDHFGFDDCATDIVEDSKMLGWFKRAIEQTKEGEVVI